MTKKRFTLICIIATFVFIASFTAPLYQVVVEEGGTTRGYMDFPWNAFPRLSEHFRIPSYIFSIAYIGIAIFALVLLFRSLLHKKQDDDKEDKWFVFGVFILAFDHAFYALMCIGITAFIPMIMSLVYAIAFLVAIFIHNKHLTEY